MSWSFDPFVVMPLTATALLYALGFAELWPKRRGIRPFEVFWFWTGWSALTLALVSPIHTLGEAAFFMHMTQHEIMMLIAAPLIIAGKPGFVMLHAFPRSTASSIARVANSRPISKTWNFIVAPLPAWILHAAAIWFWHLPRAFESTLHSNLAHAAQHLSFFGTALLFWWAVMHHRQRRLSYGMAVLYMFTTAMHTGLLGALLTLSRSVWYPTYASQSPFNLTPLEDQQLGGLIMWVPAGLVYVIAGLTFLAGWLRESDRRADAQSLILDAT